MKKRINYKLFTISLSLIAIFGNISDAATAEDSGRERRDKMNNINTLNNPLNKSIVNNDNSNTNNSNNNTGKAPRCSIGPVKKSYGGHNWIVYSCDDSKTLIVLASPSNPAVPYYFYLKPVNKNANGQNTDGASPNIGSEKYEFEGHGGTGKGKGDQLTVIRAGAELKKLTTKQIQEIIKETIKETITASKKKIN